MVQSRVPQTTCDGEAMTYIPPMIDLGMDNVAPTGRVVVAMSGGVDSSTTAALMVEAGYEVIGITLQLYDHGKAIGKNGTCCAGQDIYDARRVAESLNIPHYVLNYESQFRKSVIEEFADSYIRGETPIPCVNCNQTVKFRDLLAVAKDLNAECLVTGHYVRRVQGDDGSEMHRATDLVKDQSYFLYATTREQLDFLRFPLGGMKKNETRYHALRFNLPVAQKPESQDICFVPNGKYVELVEKLRPGACDPGDIVDPDGNVIGQHKGIINFTVGQRRGLGIAADFPLYVLRLNPASRQVVVGPKEALGQNALKVNVVNWIGPNTKPQKDSRVAVKIRSTGPPYLGALRCTERAWIVKFDTPQFGVAPGQAAVFYNEERVLGGGWIQAGS